MTSRKHLLLLGPTGVLLMLVALILQPDAGEDASAAKVIDTFAGTERALLSASVELAAAMLLVVFSAAAYDRLQSAGARPPLLLVAVAGAAVLLVGVSVDGGLQFALHHVSDDHNAQAAFTLNVLEQELFLPIVGGIALITLGLGAASRSTTALPRWFATTGVALGVVAPLGPAGFATFILGPLWLLVAGVLLFRRP